LNICLQCWILHISRIKTCATCRIETAHSYGATEFHLRFLWGSCCSIFGFLCGVFVIVVNKGYSSAVNKGYSSVVNKGYSSALNKGYSSVVNKGYSSVVNKGLQLYCGTLRVLLMEKQEYLYNIINMRE
jgi:hypothetical protein